jgi:hypothetical protein
MKKNTSLKTKSPKNEKKIEPQKGLFDHLTAIRTSKNPNYYNSLTDQEKKGFNHWSILNGLSMDINLIELVVHLWQDGYYDKIPSPQFYQLLVDVVPKSSQRIMWVKKSKKINQSLLDNISTWFSISHRESRDYLNVFMASDEGIKHLAWILEGVGLNEKEIEELLIGDTNE